MGQAQLLRPSRVRRHRTGHAGESLDGRTLIRLFLLGLLLLATGAYVGSLHAPGSKGVAGKIVNPEDPPDQWRFAPLANARVAVVWHGNVLDNPVHASSQCVRAVEVTTDRDGRYSVPGIWLYPSWPMVVDVQPVAYLYEPGYGAPYRTEMPVLNIPPPFTVMGEPKPAAVPGNFLFFDPLENYRCPLSGSRFPRPR